MTKLPNRTTAQRLVKIYRVPAFYNNDIDMLENQLASQAGFLLKK